jgi:hypothetical protein
MPMRRLKPPHASKEPVSKARFPAMSLMKLAILPAPFAFGAMLYTLLVTENSLGFGLARLVGGPLSLSD